VTRTSDRKRKKGRGEVKGKGGMEGEERGNDGDGSDGGDDGDGSDGGDEDFAFTLAAIE